MNDSNYNGANVGIKLAPSILENLDNVGTDDFDARKRLEKHKHEGDTQGLQVRFVA